ncbi:MAG: TolC family protein [Dysgonamonadaceae bacterium]|jgi:outer membrane protein TolC|nr:TolC family protein [Dysgonamonadaceae bacterium]
MKIGLSKKMSIAALAFLIPLLTVAQEKQPPLELTLDGAIRIALSENPSVKVADLEVQKKKYAKRSSHSALYPQIDIVGQYSRTLKKQVMYMDGAFGGDMFAPIISGIEETLANHTDYEISTNPKEPGELAKNIGKNTPPSDPNQGISVGRDNNWTGGLQLNWPVVVPTLWKSLEISSLDVELAVESARSSKINMVHSVRKAYYGVLLAKDALHVFQESHDNAVLSYNDIRNKFKQGVVSEFDLIRADVNVKNIKPNLIQAQNAYNLATLSLKALMGVDMEQEIAIPGSLLDYEEGLYAEVLALDTSLDDNSDLKKFDIQTEQLQKTLQLYKAQFLPTIAITGNYTYMSMNNDFRFGDYKWNPYSTVSLNISIPLFDGFKKTNDIRQTKATIEQMKWQREDVVRNLQLAVNSNVNNMTNYVEQVFSTKDVVAQAKKGYEISQKLYDTGMGTLLDLNTAQLGLTQASLAFTQAIYNFLTSKADLDKTLGIGAEGAQVTSDFFKVTSDE